MKQMVMFFDLKPARCYFTPDYLLTSSTSENKSSSQVTWSTLVQHAAFFPGRITTSAAGRTSVLTDVIQLRHVSILHLCRWKPSI